MNPELEAPFRMLDEVAEEPKSIRIEIDDDDLHAIELVDALPGNQSGADQTWMHRLVEESQAHSAKATRKR